MCNSNSQPPNQESHALTTGQSGVPVMTFKEVCDIDQVCTKAIDLLQDSFVHCPGSGYIESSITQIHTFVIITE